MILKNEDIDVIELKDCPFCGSTADLWEYEYKDRIKIKCDRCRAAMYGKKTDEEILIAQWNSRS